MTGGQRIGYAFFERDPLTCARELVGCELIWNGCGGIIVETEAYSVRDDEACHTFHRPSSRGFVAAHRAGAAYIYLNYGVHWLLNVLVKGGGEDGFVLLRALQPTRGMEEMRRRRRVAAIEALCSGPGKLSQAIGVRGTDHGIDLCEGGLIGFQAAASPVETVTDVRIGISKAAHLPWRFLLAGSRFVSKKATPAKKPGR
jgi:DNA-3-methyladenine glycosylase